MLSQHCSVSLGRGMTQIFPCIYLVFSVSHVFHPAAGGNQDVGSWMMLLNSVISQLPEANLDLPSKVVMIKELLPWKMLWLCFYYWHWQFELLKEFPSACVTKVLSSPSPFFSGKSADLPEGLWQGVVGSFSIIPFQKYYPSISGNTAIAFYILAQIPDKWLLSRTVKHQTFAGREVDEIPKEWTRDVLFINPI